MLLLKVLLEILWFDTSAVYTLDSPKLAKFFSCPILPSPLIVKLLLSDYLALPDYLIVKVRGGWPARLDSPDFVLQVWAEH